MADIKHPNEAIDHAIEDAVMEHGSAEPVHLYRKVHTLTPDDLDKLTDLHYNTALREASKDFREMARADLKEELEAFIDKAEGLVKGFKVDITDEELDEIVPELLDLYRGVNNDS